MSFIDMKTVAVSYIFSNAICAVVIASLWHRNRKQFNGLGFWLADYVMQFIGLALVVMRGYLPDFVSMVAGNGLAIGGTLLLYIGLEQFLGKRSSQFHNYVILASFLAVHTWFVFAHPSLTARNINLSLALIALCAQCAWLMLRRVDMDLRPMARGAGFVFMAYVAVNLVRIYVDSVIPSGDNLFHSNSYDAVMVMMYQMLFIALTFSLFMMVNRRLAMELQEDIASRRHVEEALRFSEEKFSKAFHSSPDSVAITHISNGRFVEVNEGFSRATGYSRDEALSSTTIALDLWANPRDRESIVQTLQKERVIRNAEYDFRAKSGAIINGLLSAEIIQLESEPHIVSVIHDITGRKRMEEALHESERRYRLLAENATDVIWTMDLNLRSTYTSPAVKNLRGYEAEEAMSQPLETALTPASFEIVSRALAEELAVEKSPGKDPSRSRTLELEVIRKDGSTVWTEVVITFLRGHDGQPVEILGVTRDITERKRAEENLAHLNQQFDLILSSAAEGILGLDLDGKHTFVNPAAAQMLGYKIEELIGRRSHSLWHHTQPDGSPYPEDECKIYATHRDGMIHRVSSEVFWRKDGTSFPVEYASDPIYEQGKLAGAVVTFTDITKRKLAEEALEERTRFTNKLLEATALSTWISDAHGTAIQANPACYQFFGATEAETIGKYNVFQDNVAEQQGAMPLIRRAYETGEPVTFFLDYDFGAVDHVNVKNATHKFIKVILTPILDTHGKVSHVVSQSIDLTEIKQSEAALRASEERIRQLLMSAPDAVFVVDQDGKITFANMEATNLLGYALDEFVGMDVEKLLPSKLREGHIVNRAKYMEALRTRAMGSLLDLTAVHKEGSEIPVDIKLSPVIMEADTQVVAFMRDVTQQKLTEGRLRHQANLIDLAYAAFIVRDMKGEIQYWNTGAAWLYGWDSKEALGRNIRQLLESQPQDAVEALDERLLADGYWDGELTHTCKDGHKVVVSSRQALQRDEQGKPTVVLEVNLDITERIQKDAALREAQEQTVAQQRAFAKFEERQQIARDLHDSVNQSIHSVMLFSETLVSLLARKKYREALEVSERIQQGGQRALKEIRLLLYRSQAALVDANTDLLGALEERLNLVERRVGMKARIIQKEDVLKRCPPAWRENLYWIAIEALNNALKHSEARHVTINIRCADSCLDLSIEDDGAGFDLAQVRAGGFGMRSMRERASLLGGDLSITSSPGKGTCVHLKVGMEKPA